MARNRPLQTFVLCLLIAGIYAIAVTPARAAMNAQAAAQADSELNTCNGTGKDLRDCVAGVLDRMANNVPQAPETQRALRTAAAGIRAAVNRVQALSAIARCQSVIASALKRVRAMGGGNILLDGWGREAGLNPVARVLARMAQMIQTKG